MHKVIRLLLHWFYRPLLQHYLRKGRTFQYEGFRLFIPAGVFHPAFFGSTKVMGQFLQRQDLEGRSLLEIGCGSGLLSLIATRQGADVTAVDINPLAVECCLANSVRNGLALDALESDLFGNLPVRFYDIILSNPPYFEGMPDTAAAAAWYGGEGFHFFHRLFAGLPKYTHPGSRIWLILSESCDLDAIESIARQHQYALNSIYQESRLFEDFILFEAKPIRETYEGDPMH